MPPGRGEIIEERSQGWRSAGSDGEGGEKSEGERAEKVDLEDWNLTQDGGGEHVRMSLTTGMQKDGLRRRNRNLVARTDDGNESMPISISGTQTFNVVIETSFITVSAGASAEADIPVLTPVGAGYTSATGTQQVLPSISTPPVSPSDIPSALPFSPSPLVSHSAPTSQTTALAVATSQAVIAPTATSELASGNAPSTSKSISKTITSYLTPSSSSTGRPRNTTITSISKFYKRCCLPVTDKSQPRRRQHSGYIQQLPCPTSWLFTLVPLQQPIVMARSRPQNLLQQLLGLKCLFRCRRLRQVHLIMV